MRSPKQSTRDPKCNRARGLIRRPKPLHAVLGLVLGEAKYVLGFSTPQCHLQGRGQSGVNFTHALVLCRSLGLPERRHDTGRSGSLYVTLRSVYELVILLGLALAQSGRNV